MHKSQTKHWYDSALEYALYATVILVPAVFSPWFFTVFSAPKLLVLRMLTLLIVVLWGCKMYVEGKLVYVKDRLNMALVFYGAVCVITTIFSINIWSSLLGAGGRFIGLMSMLIFLLLPFFAINILKERKKAERLLVISVVAASILALYGIAQYFGIFQDAFHWNQDPADRVFGTVGHGNHFGAYLGMHLLIGVFLLPGVKRSGLRALLGLGLILQTVALFMTGSRGAIAASVMALIFTGIFWAAKNRKKLKLSFSRVLLALFIVVAVGSAGVSVFRDDLVKIPVVERSLQTAELLSQGKVPDRLSWWMSAIEMAQDKPFFGYGLS
ncbi:MAG TPA: O-antigen ligase family protein, partial [Candidatus Gracilibacteria bacterium]|nr:O-antigen ligase family protein [Candidatus Gracilibacteria bacterium]